MGNKRQPDRQLACPYPSIVKLTVVFLTVELLLGMQEFCCGFCLRYEKQTLAFEKLLVAFFSSSFK